MLEKRDIKNFKKNVIGRGEIEYIIYFLYVLIKSVL